MPWWQKHRSRRTWCISQPALWSSALTVCLTCGCMCACSLDLWSENHQIRSSIRTNIWNYKWMIVWGLTCQTSPSIWSTFSWVGSQWACSVSCSGSPPPPDSPAVTVLCRWTTHRAHRWPGKRQLGEVTVAASSKPTRWTCFSDVPAQVRRGRTLRSFLWQSSPEWPSSDTWSVDKDKMKQLSWEGNTNRR